MLFIGDSGWTRTLQQLYYSTFMKTYGNQASPSHMVRKYNNSTTLNLKSMNTWHDFEQKFYQDFRFTWCCEHRLSGLFMLLCCVVFWLHTNILEEHTALIIRAVIICKHVSVFLYRNYQWSEMILYFSAYQYHKHPSHLLNRPIVGGDGAEVSNFPYQVWCWKVVSLVINDKLPYHLILSTHNFCNTFRETYPVQTPVGQSTVQYLSCCQVISEPHLI
jgi:hypothetical protein